MKDDGQPMTGKQEALLAALLAEPTYAAAATKAGVSEATVYRCLRLPQFAAAYRRARRQVVESAVGRAQAATSQAVDTLIAVARTADRDADRVRAASAVLDLAFRGLDAADALGEPAEPGDASPVGTADVVQVLSRQLRQVDGSELPTEAKARLTAALSDALLRALNVDVLDKRLEALQAVLSGRKDKGR